MQWEVVIGLEIEEKFNKFLGNSNRIVNITQNKKRPLSHQAAGS